MSNIRFQNVAASFAALLFAAVFVGAAIAPVASFA